MVTSINIKGVNCQELIGSMSWSISGSKLSGQRIFKCDWADRFDLFKYLIGYVNNDGDGNTVYIPPIPFPEIPSMLCKAVKVDGFGKFTGCDAENPEYEFAKLTASYDNDRASPKGGGGEEPIQETVLGTLETTYGADYIAFDGKNFYWGDTGEKIAAELQTYKLVPTIEHTYTRFNVPVIPKRALRKSGKINDAEFSGASTGTLLFLGATSTPSIDAGSGERIYTIKYQFRERIDSTWNKFYNVDSKTWADIKDVDGNLYEPFESDSFEGLFADDNV